jgi:MFS family permease
MMNSLLNLTGPISLAFAGPVSDWVGLQVWYVAAGVLCGVSGVLGFFIPAIMNIEENNNGAAAVGEKMPTANAVSVLMETD